MGKDWKKWEAVLLRKARKAFETCMEEYDDEERKDWYEWKSRNEDCLKINEEWAVHRMRCLLKQTVKPVNDLLMEASRAAQKEAEEAQGALGLKCEYVHEQLGKMICIFGTGHSLYETVNHVDTTYLVDVIVLLQEVVSACQKKGSECLIEIAERNQGPLHEALKALRDIFTLRLSLTVTLGNYTAWDEATRKAYLHYPGVLDDDLAEERSRLYQSYGKVMFDNILTLGFIAFDSNNAKAACKKKNGKKRPKRIRPARP